MLLPPTAPLLRSAACRALPHLASSFPKYTPRPTSTSTSTTTTPRQMKPAFVHPATQFLFPRHSSTTTSTTTSTASTAPSITPPAPATTAPPALITWDQFFLLRRSRRRYNRTASVLGALLATATGAGFLGNIEVDMMPALFGMDMLTLFGLAIVGSGALGWLLGPAVGGGLFRVLNKKAMPGMVEREKQFFTHIKKNRVDPSNHSFSNPVPDYYGEKVGSIKEYRQWLRDQRIYNRKRETFL